MRFLGLTPDAVAARSPGAGVSALQASAGRSTAFGAAAFGAVSLLVFGSWAAGGPTLYRIGGELGAYLFWAALFMGGAGGALGPLVVGRGHGLRFLGAFALGFAAYAAVWMASWFALKNRSGEMLGAMAGTAAFAGVLCLAFGAPRRWFDAALYLFIGNAAGYFAGDVAYGRTGGTAGKLAWGLLYGVGFGAGIGTTLFALQSEIRRRLSGTERDGSR